MEDKASNPKGPIETLQTVMVELVDATEVFVIMTHNDGTRSSYCTTKVAYIRIRLVASQLVHEEELSRKSTTVEVTKGSVQ